VIGLHLLGFAALVSVLAPRVLTRAGWVHRSPGLGIAAWYAALLAVVSAVGVAVVSLVAPWQGVHAPVCALWLWCVRAAQGGFGLPGRLVAVAAGAAGVFLAVRLVVTAVRVVRAASARRGHHMQMLTLAGRARADLGATVVEHPQPAAYVVGGSSRRVVVTTGAIEALTGPELAAVLDHERAHAAGRHDLLLDGVRLLEAAFPRLALFPVAHRELCRLVELRADEVATVRHAPITLARAMVTMATAAAARTAPAGALSAAGGDAMERLSRLLNPPAPLAAAHRVLLGGVTGMVALVPAVLVAAAQMFPWLGMCPPFLS
jgi:Zn-dependent protease with chaperone function